MLVFNIFGILSIILSVMAHAFFMFINSSLFFILLLFSIIFSKGISFVPLNSLFHLFSRDTVTCCASNAAFLAFLSLFCRLAISCMDIFLDVDLATSRYLPSVNSSIFFPDNRTIPEDISSPVRYLIFIGLEINVITSDILLDF